MQIVEEKRQRVLGARKYTDEAPEHQPEAGFGLLRLKFGDGRLLPGDELKFRDQVRDEQPVRVQRLLQGLAPPIQFGFALAQKRLNKLLKSLR